MNVDPVISAASATAVEADAVRAAISSTARPAPAGPLSSALAFGWRGMLKIKHVPEQLLDVTVTQALPNSLGSILCRTVEAA